MVPFWEHPFDEGQLGDQEFVRVPMYVVYTYLFAELMLVDITTLIFIKMISEFSCLFFWESNSKHTLDTRKNLVSIH